MNFRSRDLLNLCYEFDCLLVIEGVCTGGTGEPCHANWPEHGKGMSIKAHDCYAVPGCRACHIALDQGSKLSGEQRKDIWLRAFWNYLPQLWMRGLLSVPWRRAVEPTGPDNSGAVIGPPKQVRREGLPEKEGATTTPHSLPPSRRRKRGSQCTASSKTFPRSWPRDLAEGSN